MASSVNSPPTPVAETSATPPTVSTGSSSGVSSAQTASSKSEESLSSTMVVQPVQRARHGGEQRSGGFCTGGGGGIGVGSGIGRGGPGGGSVPVAGVVETIVEPVVASHQAQVVEKNKPIWRIKEFKLLSREEQASRLPFSVGENITMTQLQVKRDGLESGGCFRWEFKDSKAWIYELPHPSHDSTAHEVIKRLEKQMGEHDNDVFCAASLSCDNNAANWSYEPDGSLTVRGFRPGPGHPEAADVSGNKWPNIIVEVAYQETEPHVRAKALDWLQTATNDNNGVQQVIVVKIGNTQRLDGHRTMKAWRYERGAVENPVQSIEFGNHGHHVATEAGLPAMQLHIPVASLYLPNNPPADLAGPLVLDLYYVRRAIEENL